MKPSLRLSDNLRRRLGLAVLLPATCIGAIAIPTHLQNAQAQIFNRERRIVLSGNVYVLQNGNSMRGETITYLIDEGRFIALPRSNRQVESTYIVSDPESPTSPVAPPVTPPKPKSTFKTPVSKPASGR